MFSIELWMINFLQKSIMLLIPSTSGLFPKTQYVSVKQGVEKKIEDVD